MKKLIVFSAFFASTLLFAVPASAHVRLSPSTAVVGRQVFDVRIPNEKDIPTTKVMLIVPEEVEITGVMPIPGWTHTVKKVPVESDHDEMAEAEGGHAHEEATERISEITWQGGEIKDGEYMNFSINTNYTGSPTKLVWKAYQTYSDGSVVPWDDSSADNPAPTVDITEKSALETLQGSVSALQADVAKSDNEGFEPDLNTWLAGAALLVATGSILYNIRKQQ